MLNKAATTEISNRSMEDLSNWAPKLVEEVENYPEYWTLKGWRCILPVAK